ncbi:HlyD family secretion protein [Mucilaginibacter paludis]|uniref:Secretion protein HlyD family protein n=1 Tax=Mucilaginibacter paludis DSM 18603 TaxID=714943 RepID=H1YIG1_9SPHI|nr:HlyD family efflux transporter periplasmic adaptor subunit [Mucilaginibacter paludis]EHQ27574.1 secretion protein HlyD family protein [Mucilaginibacter paludis DSM 18603]
MKTESDNILSHHSEEIDEIIAAPPSWLIRWGMIVFFAILVLILALSEFISYPDVIISKLKINSLNAPKSISPRVSGKLIKLLVKENEDVISGQPLGYIESTADHKSVLQLLSELKVAQKNALVTRYFTFLALPDSEVYQLGELQKNYEIFYQSYLTYKASTGNGFYLKQRSLLQKDLSDILKERENLTSQKALQDKQVSLATQEYEMHKRLFEQKVEAKMELNRQEAIFFSSQVPVAQIKSSILTNYSDYSTKQKEILEIDRHIGESKTLFLQSLNSLISDIENWKSQYILCAPESGKVIFSLALQENQFVNPSQELLYIHSGSQDFFGEMPIPQFNMGKVEAGQDVLIKLKGYPYQEYGIVRGKIYFITDVPLKDSIFMSTVKFKIQNLPKHKSITIKNGMEADAEIITSNTSLLSRILKNLSPTLK